MSIAKIAEHITHAFSRMYLYFYRRRDPRAYRPRPETLAVMEHLASTGPLTVTEAARHLDRSASATSEQIDRMINRGLLERIPDARDRRRHLVWLSELGMKTLNEERRVLDDARLKAALEMMTEEQRTALVDGLSALLDAAEKASRLTVRSTTKKGRQK